MRYIKYVNYTTYRIVLDEEFILQIIINRDWYSDWMSFSVKIEVIK